MKSNLPMLALGLAAILWLTGCASIRQQNRLNQYKAMLDPAMGSMTEQQAAETFGIPQEQETVGDEDFWHYHESFGVRGYGVGLTPNPYNPYLQTTVTSTGGREVYDDFTLIFDSNKVLKSWRASVQR